MVDENKISIVVPIFNEEGNIRKLYDELTITLPKITDNYEIIFVDDGSKDKSFQIVAELNKQDEKVAGLSLSRNFGQQVALLAGMKHADGGVVITMDADLQHPPSVIPEIYKAYKEGNDIVNTKRIKTENIGFVKNWTSILFYKIINRLAYIRIEPAAADFRLMSRKAIDAFLSMPERDRFTKGLISWLGFKQCLISYSADKRYSGKTKYSLKKLFALSLDGVTSFSSKPLRVSFYTGFIIFILGIIYAIYAIIRNLNGMTVQGWTSILVTVLILGGFQLLSLGIVGEYIARIFNEVKARPHFFIKDKIGK